MSKDILLQMVANKRGGIDPSVVIQSAIIETFQLAPGTDCRIELDSNTGQYKVFRYWKVVPDEAYDEFSSSHVHIPFSKARQKNFTVQVGESLSEEIHFSRIEFQKFKRLFSQGIHKAERDRVTETYRDRLGTILMATVQRQQFSREGTILEIEEDVEVLLSHDQMIPKEEIRVNDRLYVYLYDIDPNAKGPQLLVSRTAPGLLEGLFKLKILEVGSGIIEIKSVARDPGFRSKVAVKTNDGRLNPIGTCIGRSGERIQAISNELNDEHIDIILWDDNPAQLAINALAPAEVIAITMDEDNYVMDIAVRLEDLSRAIGRNGQNIRLISQLIGWRLNIMNAEEAEQKNIEVSHQIESLFTQQLGIDPTVAQQCIQKGLTTLEDLAYAKEQELADLLDLSFDKIQHLRHRANDLLLEKAFAAELATVDTTEAQAGPLESLPGMTSEVLEVLNQHGIDSQESLAELSIDDLLEIAPLNRDKAGQLIMSARAHWFKKSEET